MMYITLFIPLSQNLMRLELINIVFHVTKLQIYNKIMVKQERCVSAMFIYKNKLLTFGTRVLHQSNVHEKVSANEKNK